MEPMTMLAIGGAVAGGLSSIFGGKAQGAAIRAQNEQAMRNWIASNSQKTFANAREQFQSTYAFTQQLKRNSAIAQNAYAYQYDAMNVLDANRTTAQTEMANSLSSQRAALTNALMNKGISSSSGAYAMLATSQALDAIDKAGQANAAIEQQKNEINKQFNAMMSQQTENIFMPNIQLYDEAPTLGDASAAEAGGMISGLVQIGGAVAGAAVGAMDKMGSTTTASTPKVNKFGTDVSRAPTGYNVTSTASGSTLSRQPQMFSLYRR
jgi:hypothetical protein